MKMRIVSYLLSIAVIFIQIGCAAQKSYRSSLDENVTMSADCVKTYATVENAPSDVGGNSTQYATPDWSTVPPLSTESQCWTTAWEHHQSYDLLFAEFDDAGWAYGEGASYGKQIAFVMRRLRKFLQDEDGKDVQPLNIVVFTHGWHHTAEANDNNVKQFRFILQKTAEIEEKLCDVSSKDCASGNLGADRPWKKKRRVVGIYVGWRGDSILGPGIEMASIWDRKLAAETVAQGAIQELFANLHNFYVRHSCHRRSDTAEEVEKTNGKIPFLTCADVRMLVIGHSFGGLITYRSLANRLISNVAETYRSEEAGSAENRYAYSFGDLVVLINPAFEATRLEPLAHSASIRKYPAPSPETPDRVGQLPVLLIVQSEGDTATERLFPLFRNVTTVFDDPRGYAQKATSVRGVGWSDRYKSHVLNVEQGEGYMCPQQDGILACENAWWLEQRAARYKGFNDPVLRLPQDLVLRQAVNPIEGLARPDFDPIWVVRASKEVVMDHNDLLNIQFIRFLRQIYYTVLREADCVVAKELNPEFSMDQLVKGCR